MKLAFFDDFKLGVVTGDKVVDVSDVVTVSYTHLTLPTNREV